MPQETTLLGILLWEDFVAAFAVDSELFDAFEYCDSFIVVFETREVDKVADVDIYLLDRLNIASASTL